MPAEREKHVGPGQESDGGAATHKKAIAGVNNRDSREQQFFGLFRRTISKGCIRLPPQWLTNEQLSLYLIAWPIHAPEHVLALLTDRWRILQERLWTQSLHDERIETLQRLICSRTAPAVVDKSNSLRISRQLRELVAFGREVILIGRLDKFEIWPADKYEASMPRELSLAEKLEKEIAL